MGTGLLRWLLRRLISFGRLTVIFPDGQSESYGAADASPTVTLRLKDPAILRRVLLHPDLTLGEGYMDETIVIEQGTLRDLLDILLASRMRVGEDGLIGFILNFSGYVGKIFASANRIGRAEQNVRHHYDISHRLYELFLDADMQYSCAYWREGTQSLEQAQLDKKRHIARKLLLKPGMSVLDIGCGWGGLALHLAREHGVKVTGVTLSQDQFATATRRAAEAGLSDLVTFKLLDYRLDTGTYDRIVSVGMFEHVGLRSFPEFFRHVAKALKQDGVALIHTIAKQSPGNDEWTRTYIFPGGYLPVLSEIAPAIEASRLVYADIEAWRLHYARTLRAWDDRFQAHRSELPPELDARFQRMWEFYLQSSERSFVYGGLYNLQIQLAKKVGTVPITRDYLYDPPLPAAEALPRRDAAE
jgi:cyclopropane-fatty-acyl-phospholipid synthase